MTTGNNPRLIKIKLIVRKNEYLKKGMFTRENDKMLHILNEYIEYLILWPLKKETDNTYKHQMTRGIKFGCKVQTVQDEQEK